jgi:hypothetical protein
MLNRGDIGRSLESLRENVECYYDDRTGFRVYIEELVEDPQSPGVLTKPEYIDQLGFNEMKADNPKDRYNHYFR